MWEPPSHNSRVLGAPAGLDGLGTHNAAPTPGNPAAAPHPEWVRLGCGECISLEQLRGHVGNHMLAAMLAGTLTIEDAFLPLGDMNGYAPLCRADMLLVLLPQELDALCKHLALAVESAFAGSPSRRQRPASSRVKRTVLDTCERLAECLASISRQTERLHSLRAAGQPRTSEADRLLRWQLASLADELQALQQAPGGAAALPLPLYSMLTEGRMFACLASLLHGTSLAEVAARGALFYELLRLLRAAAALPDLTQHLYRPQRLGPGLQVSLMGCLQPLVMQAHRVVLAAARHGSGGGVGFAHAAALGTPPHQPSRHLLADSTAPDFAAADSVASADPHALVTRRKMCRKLVDVSAELMAHGTSSSSSSSIQAQQHPGHLPPTCGAAAVAPGAAEEQSIVSHFLAGLQPIPPASSSWWSASSVAADSSAAELSSSLRSISLTGVSDYGDASGEQQHGARAALPLTDGLQAGLPSPGGAGGRAGAERRAYQSASCDPNAGSSGVAGGSRGAGGAAAAYRHDDAAPRSLSVPNTASAAEPHHVPFPATTSTRSSVEAALAVAAALDCSDATQLGSHPAYSPQARNHIVHSAPHLTAQRRDSGGMPLQHEDTEAADAAAASTASETAARTPQPVAAAAAVWSTLRDSRDQGMVQGGFRDQHAIQWDQEVRDQGPAAADDDSSRRSQADPSGAMGEDAAAAAAAAVAADARPPDEDYSWLDALGDSNSAAAADASVVLIGPKAPLSALVQRYQEHAGILSARLLSLEGEFPSCRRVAGDGSCFYRAFLFALLEGLMCEGRLQAASRLASRLLQVSRDITAADCFRIEDVAQALHGASLMQSALAHMWFSNTGPSYSPSGPGSYSPGGTGSSGSKYSARAAVPPELAPFLTPGPADSGPGSSSSSPGWHHQKGDAVNTSSHDREGPASGGGGGSLLDLTGLEGLFNHPEASGAMVKLARLAASLELRAHAQRYEPFLAGCPGLQGLTIPKVCARHVEPFGQEVEQLQVIALLQALQVTLGILDVAGRSEVAYVKHCPLAPGVDAAPCSPRPRATGAESVERSSSCSSSVNTAPDLWLVHLPGHYEIIYGSKAFDVHAGKLTTVV